MSIARTMLCLGKLPLPTITLDHPLDKIFGDIPARSPSLTHASVMHYLVDLFFIENLLLPGYDFGKGA
jgi:hypothetical protein